ncbi:MAG: DsbA family protein [Burkholderiales bacterium]
MSLKTLLMPAIMARMLSQVRLERQRERAERARRARGQPHVVHYFHQSDDPYSALAAQALPQLAARYDVSLLPHVVGPPTDAAAPERAMLVAYSRRDAALLAQRHALDFADGGAQPGDAAVAAATARLVAAAMDGSFVEVAQQVGAALWAETGMPAATPSAPSAVVAQHLADAERLRTRLGHYLGATFHYAGEWYWGIDRLHHLERRLQALDAARPGTGGPLYPPGEDLTRNTPAPGAPVLDFFLSLRSPYSAIAAPRVFDLARHTGAQLRLRFVLPMVMRGLPVPREKRFYIVQDTAREARLRGIAFGRLNDPVGRPTERGLAILALALRAGRAEEYVRAFMHGVWAEGIDAGSDTGLRRIVERAGLGWRDAQEALEDQGWRATAEENRREMFALGLWGVPSFRVGEVAVWGQDRLWAVQQALVGDAHSPAAGLT